MSHTSRGGLSTAVADVRSEPRARTHLRNLRETGLDSLCGRTAIDNAPFQSELQEPNPPRVGIQSPCEGRKRVGYVRIRLDSELELSEGPQQLKVDLQLGRCDKGNPCDTFTDMELRLVDVFRRIMKRDDGLRR
jgi:hypothetical protein